jgi:hypothetical protein
MGWRIRVDIHGNGLCNGPCPASHWNLGFPVPVQPANDMNEDDFQIVMMHEFGHTFFDGAQTSSNNGVNFPFLECNENVSSPFGDLTDRFACTEEINIGRLPSNGDVYAPGATLIQTEPATTLPATPGSPSTWSQRLLYTHQNPRTAGGLGGDSLFSGINSLSPSEDDEFVVFLSPNQNTPVVRDAVRPNIPDGSVPMEILLRPSVAYDYVRGNTWTFGRASVRSLIF